MSEESVMRYFEEQPIQKAETMLKVIKVILKRRSALSSLSHEKSYIKPLSKQIKKVHFSDIGGYPVSQLDPHDPGSFNAMVSNQGQMLPSVGDITLKMLQANIDSLGISNAKQNPLHGVYAPEEQFTSSQMANFSKAQLDSAPSEKYVPAPPGYKLQPDGSAIKEKPEELPF